MGGRRLKGNGETRNLHVNSIKGTTHFNHAAAGYFLRLHDLMKTTTHGVDQRRAQRVVRTGVSNALFLPQRLTQLDTVNSRTRLYFGIRRHSVEAVWRKTKPMINYYHFNGPVLGRIGSCREEFGRLRNHSWLLSALWNCIKFQFSACNVMASICHPSRFFYYYYYYWWSVLKNLSATCPRDGAASALQAFLPPPSSFLHLCYRKNIKDCVCVQAQTPLWWNKLQLNIRN